MPLRRLIPMMKRTASHLRAGFFLTVALTLSWTTSNLFASNDLGDRISSAQNRWRGSNVAFWGEAIPRHPDQAKYPEERLQYILDRLVYVSPLRGYDIRVYVTPNDQINAQTDGKRIVVNSGLLNALGHDDDQMAAVLAHELAHIIADHHSHRSSQNTSHVLLQAAAPLLSFVPYGSYASMGVRELSNVSQASFSREQEKEADAIATILAMEAGYRPLGLTEFFDGSNGTAKTFALPTHVPLTTNVNTVSQSVALYLLRTSPFYKSHPPTPQRKQVVLSMVALHSSDHFDPSVQRGDPWTRYVYQILEKRRPKNRGRAS